MTNIVVCHTGTGNLSSQFEENNDPITEVKLIGANPQAEIRLIRNHLRGHFITTLTLESGQEGATLREKDFARIAALYSLRSLSLHGFSVQTSDVACFTNLTSLSIDTPLAEKQIWSLFVLKNLTCLHAPFDFSRPLTAPLTLAKNLPKLRRVRALPHVLPLTPEKIKDIFKTFEYQPKSILKRVFGLVDSGGHDLFHYCREALESEVPQAFDPVLQFVDNETTTPEQLLEWLDFSLNDPIYSIFDKILTLGIDVNAPLPGKEQALVVAVSGCIARSQKVYGPFVERLLASGANPEASDGFGNNPILLAARQYRPDLFKLLVNSKKQIGPSLLHTALDMAIGLGIKNCGKNETKAAHAFKIVQYVIRKKLPEQVLTAQLERIIKCSVLVPVEVVSQLLKAGAKTDVKNSAGNTVLNELLRTIQALHKEESTDRELLEAKFGYFKALVENGDSRMKSYAAILAIAKKHGLWSFVPFLETKAAGK